MRTGVPALALKFATSSPEQQELQKAWLRDRYNASEILVSLMLVAFAVATIALSWRLFVTLH